MCENVRMRYVTWLRLQKRGSIARDGMIEQRNKVGERADRCEFHKSVTDRTKYGLHSNALKSRYSAEILSSTSKQNHTGGTNQYSIF